MSLLNNRSPIFQSFITALDAAVTSCLHTLGDYFSSLLAFHLHTVDTDNFIEFQLHLGSYWFLLELEFFHFLFFILLPVANNIVTRRIETY